jgi:hypothetical protein
MNSDPIWIVKQVSYGNLFHKALKFTNDLGLLYLLLNCNAG